MHIIAMHLACRGRESGTDVLCLLSAEPGTAGISSVEMVEGEAVNLDCSVLAVAACALLGWILTRRSGLSTGQIISGQ